MYTYIFSFLQFYMHIYNTNTCIYYPIYLYTYVYIMYYTTTGFPNLLGTPTQMQQQFSDADYLEVRGPHVATRDVKPVIPKLENHPCL